MNRNVLLVLVSVKMKNPTVHYDDALHLSIYAFTCIYMCHTPVLLRSLVIWLSSLLVDVSVSIFIKHVKLTHVLCDLIWGHFAKRRLYMRHSLITRILI